MINLRFPTTAILRRGLKTLRKDKFVVTYEYGWSESARTENSQKQKSSQTASADLTAPDPVFWVDTSVSVSSDSKVVIC
jgi:hypothetical protein